MHSSGSHRNGPTMIHHNPCRVFVHRRRSHNETRCLCSSFDGGVVWRCVGRFGSDRYGVWVCGASGPERYELSGTVQFQGKPVPAGQIVFEPDSSKGNVGPQGMAEIREGKYDTRGGRGMVGGPHVVRIRGYDRLSLDEMHPPQPLFPEYETTVDLSRKTAFMTSTCRPARRSDRFVPAGGRGETPSNQGGAPPLRGLGRAR